MTTRHTKTYRIIHHLDAILWLRSQKKLEGCSIITSLPDISEFPKMNVETWKTWFQETVELVLSKCPDDGVTLFYQTDLKKDGEWIDKSYLCQKVAESAGHFLLAHKIVCRAPANIDTSNATGYSHLLCFSKNKSSKKTKTFADVTLEEGQKTWKRGMGLEACILACEITKAYTNSHTIVDPFCGHGTVLAVANELGFSAIGVEHKLKHVKIAQGLTFQNLTQR